MLPQVGKTAEISARKIENFPSQIQTLQLQEFPNKNLLKPSSIRLLIGKNQHNTRA
jgi:hypothetical protein